jgi:hypothetical protein
VFAFKPPDVGVLAVFAVVAVLEVEAVDGLEPEPDSLDPQPAASSSAEQAIMTAGRALLIWDDPFSGGPFTLSLTDGAHARLTSPARSPSGDCT